MGFMLRSKTHSIFSMAGGGNGLDFGRECVCNYWGCLVVTVWLSKRKEKNDCVCVCVDQA